MAPFRKALLNGIWDAASELEGQVALQISHDTIAEVADTLEARRVQGSRLIGRIHKVQEHQRLARSVNLIRERIEGMQRHLDAMEGQLKQVEDEMGGISPPRVST